MEHPLPHSDHIFSTLLAVVLAFSSAIFGFLEHADIVLSVIAKLVAIGAGAFSLFIAYQTYLKQKQTKS